MHHIPKEVYYFSLLCNKETVHASYIDRHLSQFTITFVNSFVSLNKLETPCEHRHELFIFVLSASSTEVAHTRCLEKVKSISGM